MRSLINIASYSIEFLTPAAFPLFLAGSFFLFVQLYYVLGLPAPEIIALQLESLYHAYGLPVLFVAAVIESVFLVSLYFPGSLVIVLSVFLVGGELDKLLALGLTVFLGGLVGYNISYAIGRYGVHHVFSRFGGARLLEKARGWDSKWGKYSLLVFGFFPSFLSIACVYRGMTKNSYVEFLIYLLLSLFIWVPVAVAMISFVVKTVDPKDSSSYLLVVALFVLWAALNIVMDQVRKKK